MLQAPLLEKLSNSTFNSSLLISYNGEETFPSFMDKTFCSKTSLKSNLLLGECKSKGIAQ